MNRSWEGAACSGGMPTAAHAPSPFRARPQSCLQMKPSRHCAIVLHDICFCMLCMLAPGPPIKHRWCANMEQPGLQPPG